MLDQIAEAKIDEVGVVIAPETGKSVKEYAKGGSEWNFKKKYIPQEPLGLAHAVKTAHTFLAESLFVTCLGDNFGISNSYLEYCVILENDIIKDIERLEDSSIGKNVKVTKNRKTEH